MDGAAGGDVVLRPLRARDRMIGRLWWIYLAMAAVGVVAYVLTPTGLGRDAIYQAFGLSSAVAIVVGVRLHRPPRVWPWYFMAAGQLLWSLADAVFSWDATIMGRDRFPSPADPLFLLGYPVIGIGMFLLIRGRRPPRDVAGFLDSAILTVGLGLLSWVLLAEPILMQYQESPLAALVAVAYPVGDILLLGLLIRLLTTPGRGTRALRLLIIAVVLSVVVDTAASSLNLLTFDDSESINPLWLLSYAAWGASALTPSMYQLSERTSEETLRFSTIRLVVLGVAVLVSPITLVVQHMVGQAVGVWPVAISSIAMFLLVVARMYVAIGQISAATRATAAAQSALRHQAAHDALTGLPNRREAVELITKTLARARRTGAVIGLLYVDLDGFKTVNDSLGHAAGDELLRTVSGRMAAAVRTGDTVARLGGDEFVVILEPLDTEASAVTVAERLIAAVREPVVLAAGQEAAVGASVGVALNSDSGLDADTLMHEADVALYRAKHEGRGRAVLFDANLRRELEHRLEIERDLTAAIAADELLVHYQPIVDLQSMGVVGYEALVRWCRGPAGLVGPGTFVPIAEQSDLICDLDAWVLRRALAQLATWNAELPDADLRMAVNISARHLARARIVDDVRQALRAADLPGAQLVLEVTETTVIDDSALTRHLEQLRELGVTLSIDDFGTGYASIARLERMPADVIKIDRRFLDPTVKSSEALLRLIVQSAHALDLLVVAEGVENDHDLTTLASIGCETAQGYLLGRPVPAAEVDLGRVHRGPTVFTGVGPAAPASARG